MKTFGKEISRAIILALLFWASVGYADVTVTLNHDGSGGVIAAIQGSGTVPDGLGTWAYFDDIGDYTHAEIQAVLSTPILFAPGISIVKLDIDHDNKPYWPDDLDDFGLNFDFETAPGTNFEIDGVSVLTGLSFSDLIPGTYSVVSDSAGVGLGTLIINEFVINSGLNDAWYYPETDGQGFFITVFPDLETVSLCQHRFKIDPL